MYDDRLKKLINIHIFFQPIYPLIYIFLLHRRKKKYPLSKRFHYMKSDVTKIMRTSSAILLLFGFISCTSTSPAENSPPPISKPNPAYVAPPYTNAKPTQLRWISGRKDLKIVALTFDDGPHPQYTPRILDELQKRNVKATFFTLGRLVDLQPQITARIAQEGHEIGNHTYTHGNLSKMSDANIQKEMNRGRDAIVRATGIHPRIMRAPYGAIKPAQRQMIYDKYGYTEIFWSVDSRDWESKNATSVTNVIMKNTRPGGIILVHDIQKAAADALPVFLDRLLAQGYKFVTVSELIRVSTLANPQDAVQKTQ